MLFVDTIFKKKLYHLFIPTVFDENLNTIFSFKDCVFCVKKNDQIYIYIYQSTAYCFINSVSAILRTFSKSEFNYF